MTSTTEERGLARSGFSPELLEEKRPGEPSWLRKIRRAAFSRFDELGFPSTRLEDWKYTNVAPLTRTPFRLAEDSVPVAAAALAPFDFPAAARIVFVNGRYRPSLSSSEGLPDGARVLSLREVLAERPEWLEPHLARIASFEDRAFTALNTAMLEDGAFVHLPPGCRLAEPIHLLFFSALSSAAAPIVSSPRNLVVADRGSEASVVETYAGAEGDLYFTNAVTEVAAGEGSVLRHYRFQRESEAALHVGSVNVSQGRDSVFRSLLVSLGSALARNETSVLFGEPGGECELNGLFAGRGSQHVDNHTVIDHASPHCVSRELYKGILDGSSRGVFYGKIIVRPGAQKTDALQTNKNVLLSREALVNSTPALEIHADDVKCKHGSTIGQLDAGALFYLRSRGIGEQEARGLLTYAFAADLLSRIPIPSVRAGLEEFLRGRLGQSREA